MSECNEPTRHAPHGSPGDWWCVGVPKDAAAALLDSQPLLDREAVWRGIYSAAIQHLNPSGVADKATDAVMAMARPMPTREQIDAFLQEWRARPPGQPTQQEAVNYRRKMRDALLALLNGAES